MNISELIDFSFLLQSALKDRQKQQITDAGLDPENPEDIEIFLSSNPDARVPDFEHIRAVAPDIAVDYERLSLDAKNPADMSYYLSRLRRDLKILPAETRVIF